MWWMPTIMSTASSKQGGGGGGQWAARACLGQAPWLCVVHKTWTTCCNCAVSRFTGMHVGLVVHACVLLLLISCATSQVEVVKHVSFLQLCVRWFGVSFQFGLRMHCAAGSASLVYRFSSCCICRFDASCCHSTLQFAVFKHLYNVFHQLL